jgi:integrase
MLMIEKHTLRKEYTTKEDWLQDIFTNSNSTASLKNAETALRTFAVFCKVKVGLDYPDIADLDIEKAQKLKQQELTKMERYQIDQEYWSKVKARYDEVCQMAQEQIIQQYQSWFEAGDIQSICTSIQSWIRFCSQDQPEVRQRRHMKWKAKKSSSIKSYWTPIKDYLRICHGIRIMAEDVKDYLKFSKDTKQEPEPLELEHIKLILAHAEPRRRALYYVLLTSAMREGEGLSLKRSNFKTDVRPIRIHLHAKDTKMKESRDTFITEEAWERVKPIYDAVKEGEYLFHDYILGERVSSNVESYKVIPKPTPTPIHDAVRNESRHFLRLREKIGEKYGHKNPCDEFPEGTGVLKRYEDSVRFCVHIHAMRAYCMTVAEGVHGNNYAHALGGHSSYLGQYIRKSEKQKAKMYLELEKHLLLESSKVHSEQFHEAELQEMQEKILKLEAKAERNEEPKMFKEEFDGVGATS